MHKLIKIYFLRFKYFVWFHTPEIIWLKLSSPIRKYRESQYNEKLKSYGVLNPDKTFYIIRKGRQDMVSLQTLIMSLLA